LYEHRTEIEIVGIHLVHLPFWVVRYSFAPKSPFRFMTTARERRLLIQGHTLAVLDAELPLSNTDKVMTNLVVCGSMAVVSLALSLFLHPLFFLMVMIFSAVCVLSAWKIFSKDKPDSDLGSGADLQEPAL
jgi:hypothetical protein